MSDRLLRELGDLARSETKAEEARFDERWDRLAAGTLTAEEEAELKALSESSPENQEAFEAFRPLGADFQARVVSAINAERAKPVAAPQPEPQKPPSRVLPFRRVIRRAEVWVGFAAAVAAGVFFLVRTPAVQPLPPYAFDDLIGNQTVRGGQLGPARGTPVFDPESQLMFVVRPPHPVTTPVEAKAFLAHGAEVFSWQPGKVGTGGSFRFDGRLNGFEPGEWKVWVVVGRPDRIPSASDLQTELRAGRTQSADWQAISKDLLIGPRASP
ncbi:MAG TPA: hypothetical protein VGS07_28770 [Thermoanaerobaculia bacterium]|jgi:hypothetical protein|nr:hypothetical protein [Thermoanaerobaculia bacterium]